MLALHLSYYIDKSTVGFCGVVHHEINSLASDTFSLHTSRLSLLFPTNQAITQHGRY